MRVLSVNTSLPQETQYQGKVISTGIFKRAVDTPVYVSKSGLIGDQQVDLKNHGGEHKAVYAFSGGHYSFWEKNLNLTSLDHGSFGENLTISEFNEDNIYIGDEISIGGCVLQVTQPRVPCYKLGIALNNKNIPREFVARSDTGVYLRVMKEGYVRSGDIVAVQRKGSNVSVKSLFMAYFNITHNDSKDVMERAVMIPALSPEWKKKISKRLSI